MGEMGMASLLQLAANQQGYDPRNPPLPPKRPKQKHPHIPKDAMQWLLDQNDMLPGFEEWQKMGAAPGVQILGDEHTGQAPPPPPPPGVTTTPGPTALPPNPDKTFDPHNDAWLRLQLMRAIAERGWNI